MRSYPRAALAVLLTPALAAAAMNVTHLVPAYMPCPAGQTMCMPVKESSFTFERAVLKSSQAPFTAPDKLAFIVELRGVRDAAGSLVTTSTTDPADDFVVVISPGRTVLLEQGLQLEPSSPLLPRLSVRIDLTNGKGKKPYRTPPETPTSGFVNESVAAPVILDSQGKRFAVTGARSRQ